MSYLGLLHDGTSLDYLEAMPSGGIDVLDHRVYWLFPNGAVRCCSARDLHQRCPSEASKADSIDNYECIAEVLGFKYLGGQCDVTDLLQDKGALKEERWKAYGWRLPASSVASCWWLTNPIGAAEEEPRETMRQQGRRRRLRMSKTQLIRSLRQTIQIQMVW